MELSGCSLVLSPSTNKIFNGCCCEITCSLILSSGETTKQISEIVLSTGGGNTSVITEINGVAYTVPSGAPLPLTLNKFGAISITFNLCAPAIIGQIDALSLGVTWTNAGGGSQAIAFDLENLDPSLYFTTLSPHNFGLLPLGATAQTSTEFNNPKICDAEFTINQIPLSGNGCADVTTNQPSPFTVPAGATLPILIDWQPTTIGAFECSVGFSLCGTTYGLRVSGEAVAVSACLNCVNITYKTQLPCGK